MIMNVETKDFEKVISEGVTIIDFSATWCGPCRMLHPMLESFASSNPSVKIVKIDVDAQADLARMFNIMSVPTLLLYKDGRLLSTKQGFMTVEMISEWINGVK